MKRPWRNRAIAAYTGILLACFVIAMLVGWLRFARQIDDDAYDWMFRLNPPAARSSEAVVLAIDDATFNAMHGVRSLRTILAQALEQIAPLQPKVTAVDVILADAGDEREDATLERAFEHTHNLVLATTLVDGQWQDPLPRFRKHVAALGDTAADLESRDGVTRQVSLERSAAHKRYWALPLEAFNLAHGAQARPLESQSDLQVGAAIVPRRPLFVRYSEAGLPLVSFQDASLHQELLAGFAGKVVFVGVYSDTAARDRVTTPYGAREYGVDVNAEAFETLAHGQYLRRAGDSAVLGLQFLIAVLTAAVFLFLVGWPAYLTSAALVAAVHALPFLLFRQGIVLPYFAPSATAWLSVSALAAYQHFTVRRALRASESERSRYREAIHWVTHEMRSPLTTIQGSSEIIGRYNLNDDKRKQIAQMINSESKRLARMIQTFLDVERISEGEIELKRELFEAGGVVQSCVDRVRPLAERKAIEIDVDGALEGELQGDRELMEYAIYNLLTNAIKYSSSGTRVTVSTQLKGEELRLSVRDQGIGMDSKELRQIFRKFYRTKRAEASGEVGTGIGLSIVDQIVGHHGGRMEVTSQPNVGSCFTVVLPARVSTVSSL